MKTCRWLMSGVVLLLLGGQALGQVRMPEGGPLPAKVLREDDTLVRVWVAHQGYRPREAADDKAAPVALTKPAEFMQPFHVAAQHPHNPKDPRVKPQWFLLVKADDKGNVLKDNGHLGWAHARDVVRYPQAIKDAGTKLYRMAMIVNTIKTLKATGGKYVPEAPVYLSPRPDETRKGQSIRLNHLFFVYADTHPASDKEEEGLALIGRAPEFSEIDPKSGAETVVGWVEKHRLCIWNTREALEFDRETTLPTMPAKSRRQKPALVYRDHDDAYTVWAGKTVPALFREPLDKKTLVSLEMTPGQPRFPLLPWRESKTNPKLTQVHQNTGTNLRRVGIYGGVMSKDGKLAFEGGEISDFQEKLKAMEAQVTLTEVLFVIDDTKSMGVWFRAAGLACQKLLEDLTNHPTRKVRVAVTFYNDIVEPDKKEKPEKVAESLRKAIDTKLGSLVDFKTGGQQLVDELLKREDHGGGDPREQLFRGISFALDAAKFQRFSRKLLVVIGDTGNNHAYDPFEMSPTVEEIAKKLTKDNMTPIEFYGIQVLDPDKYVKDPTGLKAKEDKEAVLAFRTEIKTILKHVEKRLKNHRFKDHHYAGDYIMLEDTDTLRKKLEERYEALQKRSEEFRKKIVNLSDGNLPAVADAALEALAEEFEVKLDILRKTKGAQIFEIGYVWEKDTAGVPQMRKRVLVNKSEVEDLLALLRGLEKRTLKVKNLVAAVIKTQAGEGVEITEERARKLPLSDILHKVYGFQMRSPLLNRKLEDANSFDLKDQDLLDLKLKRMRLEDVLNDRHQEYEARVEVIGETKLRVWEAKGQPVPRPRSFILGSAESMRWYWLDYDREWP